MSGRGRVAWIAAGVAGAAVLAWLVEPSTPAPIGRGSAAPGFRLPRLDGGADVELEALRGRVVLVNFWATWCKPCEDEMPAMDRLYRTLGGQDFELLAVSVDDAPDEVAAFVERLGVGFPVLLDPDETAARAYQTFRYPETLLIDRDGTILERYVGPKEWDAAPYLARLRRLIDGEA